MTALLWTRDPPYCLVGSNGSILVSLDTKALFSQFSQYKEAAVLNSGRGNRLFAMMSPNFSDAYDSAAHEQC